MKSKKLKIKNFLLVLGLIFGLLVITSPSVYALRPAIPPRPPRCQQTHPGHPLTLKGRGALRGHGRGQIHYQIEKGRAIVRGWGVAAVKGTEEVKAFGWGKKIQLGDWKVYFGKGVLKAWGEDFVIFAWGSFQTKAGGEGKVTFRGWWKVCYRGFGINPIPLEPPKELESE